MTGHRKTGDRRTVFRSPGTPGDRLPLHPLSPGPHSIQRHAQGQTWLDHLNAFDVSVPSAPIHTSESRLTLDSLVLPPSSAHRRRLRPHPRIRVGAGKESNSIIHTDSKIWPGPSASYFERPGFPFFLLLAHWGTTDIAVTTPRFRGCRYRTLPPPRPASGGNGGPFPPLIP